MTERTGWEMVREWDAAADRPRMKLSDARRDADVAKHIEGLNGGLRHCAIEARAFLERLEGLATKWESGKWVQFSELRTILGKREQSGQVDK